MTGSSLLDSSFGIPAGVECNTLPTEAQATSTVLTRMSSHTVAIVQELDGPMIGEYPQHCRLGLVTRTGLW